ncbi:MAG: hypothetical protein JXB49_33690 [Bacteroidales bacterium]|nr:hypothetical protein [Bacteroidales bacterium]
MKACWLTSFCLLLILHSGCKNTSANEHSQITSDKNATPLTCTLYTNLKTISAKNILFGHQDALAYGIGWEAQPFRTDVCDVTENHPAVFGWDIGHIGDSLNIDGVDFKKMTDWIKEVYYKNGISTISWHHRNPLNDSSCWNTAKVIDQILPGGKLNAKYTNELDLLAAFFHSLTDSSGNSIPVIFRPFHEMNQFWFWWGTRSCSDEEFIQLWQYTADYLRNTKNVHNVLLCYSPSRFKTTQSYMSRYPGDSYVDILGLDYYNSLSAPEEKQLMISQLENLVDLAHEKNKIAALTETGYQGIENENWWTECFAPVLFASSKTDDLLYVLVWRNSNTSHFFAPYAGQQSADDFRKFEKNPRTMFLDDMPKIYNKVN